MHIRSSLLCLLLLCAAAHADVQWASNKVFTVAAPSDGKAYAEFVLTNTGTYPVKILGARTSCGCTAAVADAGEIAPGGKGKIEVSFKTLNRRGLYEEPIVVTTNDPAARESTVTLRVLIRDALTVLPTLLFWQADEALTPKVIHITPMEGYNVKEVRAECADPNLELKMETTGAGPEYKLTVTPKAAHLRATISVTADMSARPAKVFAAHVRVL